MTAQDWPRLYRTLETDGLVPFASETSIETNHAHFRAMHLDLAAVRSALAAAEVRPRFVTLHCDVLTIPDHTTLVLESSILTIIARRVEAGATGSIALDYRSSQTASLVFFADEVEGALNVATTNGAAARFAIDAGPPSGGVQFRFRDGAAVSIPVQHEQAIGATQLEALRRALATEFLFASLLHDEQPELALSMLRFVRRWSAASNELLDLFLRSTSMLASLAATVDAQKNGAAFVPYLARTVHTDLLKAFVAEARQYESDYRALAMQRELTAQNIELARRLAKQQLHQSDYVTQVIQQTKLNYDNALAAVATAETNFRAAQRKLTDVRIDFERVGVPEWRTRQILGALMNLTGAIVEFAVGIAEAVATSGVAAGAAAKGAADTVKSVANAAETGSKVAAMAEKLGGAMEKLEAAGKALNALLTMTAKLVATATDMQSADASANAFREVDVNGTELAATSEWEIYRLTSGEALIEPVEQGVGFASELKVAVESIAIYGQALSAARVGAVVAGQAYANALLQRELSRRQQQNLEQYVTALREREAPAVELMQRFHQRYLDVKSSMFAALLAYRASYFYWALQPSQIRPRIIDPVDTIDAGLKHLTAIALDDQRALESFSPPPQELTRKRMVIDDADVLASLRTTRAARWNVPLDAAPLLGLDRVRLTSVRIWLEGAKGDASQAVTLQVRTSGNYLDRLRGRRYQFIAQPLRLRFQYQLSAQRGPRADWKFDDGAFGQVVGDAAVDREVSHAYFRPTPFTQWEVRLDPTAAGVDVSGVTKITMELSGSAIPELG